MIHDTGYGDGTVSLVTRTFLEDTEHAQVYIPAGQSWVSAEPRNATDDEVERITALALVRMLAENKDKDDSHG